MAEHASAHTARSTTIVVASALAAQQWEMQLAAAEVAGGALAWETPPVKSYGAWLDELWLGHAGENPALSANQSLALWRRIVGESAEGEELIGEAGAAQWAAAAWSLLHRWQVDLAAQRARADQVDYRAFLSWSRRFRSWLDDQGYVDRAELEARLTEGGRAGDRLHTADLDESHPARAALFAALTTRGTTIDTLAVPTTGTTRHAARLADAADELRAAFAWAGYRLAAAPRARLAIVVPAAARRGLELERHAAALPPELCWTGGRTLAGEPVLGAAVDALALASSHTPYATFGRWLRSPFFAAARDEQLARTRLDTELRAELRSQLPFKRAYRSGVSELLDTRAPVSARALTAALAVLEGARRATPGRWANLFARFLTALGWQAPAARAVLLAWQGTLDELSRLTPIAGEVSLDTALAEIGRLLERSTPAVLPVRGVHVLAHIDEVGPGYDAVWVTGFTDNAWPEPPHGNPLLPIALQRTLGMPYSSPRDAQERSARALARLVRRSPELVISWPARVYDYETEPSPAIRDWPLVEAREIERWTAPKARTAAARETLADDAPPLASTRVAGGASALGRQARCPLRAFFQDRLGARALEPLGFGVPARLRGIATHRALERLLDDLPEQGALAAKAAAIASSVEQALAKLFARARAPLAPLYALEAEHLQQVLAALLREEARRAPFRVQAVEQRAAFTVGPLSFDVRIDRIDELADGKLVIVDYKTGERATSGDWFEPRLRDAQVPLYASQLGESVGAAVVARLTAEEAKYFGFWPDGAFPGRPARAAHPHSAEQLALWRQQLTELAAEIKAGDTRIFTADYEDAAGAYAPLTRVFEQLALARGALKPW